MATKTIKKPVRQPAEKKKELKKVVSVKKGIAGSKKKKPLLIVSGEMCFWVNNGAALSSMKDLCDALRTMSEEQFFHHAGMGRNDFSAWVFGVLGDKKCADELLKAKDKKAALSAVEKHLKAYSV
jgi:hypothetical protein